MLRPDWLAFDLRGLPMLCPVRFQLRAIGDQHERLLLIDTAKQTGNQALRALVAPMRIFH